MKGYPTLGLVLVIHSEDEKILVMSGTQGTEDGVSTLSELDTNIIHLAVSQTEELIRATFSVRETQPLPENQYVSETQLNQCSH